MQIEKLDYDHSLARQNMVLRQIRPNKVTDKRILKAFIETPREQFVPVALRGLCYSDKNLSLTPERTLLSPLILAQMMQIAQVSLKDKILVVGCSTGYSLAVLSKICAQVIGLENKPAFLNLAQQNLKEITSVEIVHSNLSQGCASLAPYDVIIIEGGIFMPPPVILDQLSTKGGRLVAILLNEHYNETLRQMGKGAVWVKNGDIVTRKIFLNTYAEPLSDFHQPQSFKFN